MSNSQVSPITLLPTDSILRCNLLSNAHEKMHFILASYVIFASISLFYSLILLLVYYSSGDNYFGYLVMVCGAIPRVIYYVFVYIFGQRHKTFQLYASYPLPIIFSIVITECYVYVGEEGKILSRYTISLIL